MHTTEDNAGALAGLRVIDMTTIVLGPLAAQVLGDMGADVIKVESPDGDAMRQAGPPPAAGMGSVFLSANRNKRSVVLDLKRRGAARALDALLDTADVMLHNMRPGAITRLGFDYGRVGADRPQLVYCGTYGFRASGPYGNKPAYDDMIQAASGLAALQRPGEPPAYSTALIADKVTALTVVGAITTALVHRFRTGRGQSIEVPMFETLTAFNMVEHLYGASYEPPRGPAGYPRTLSPDRRPYQTRDGHIGVLPYSDRQWQAFFEVAGRADLAGDPRYATVASRLAHIDELYAALAACLTTRRSAEWLDALDAANVPSMPINTPAMLLTDPHLDAVSFWHFHEDPDLGTLRMPGITTRFSDSPASIRRMAPRLGEHTREVLREGGLTNADVEALIEAGCAVQHEPAGSP